ncbi:MAG: hypothetical protein BWY40_01261 [bacterium ADurb.Bin270]|nr:MAG: hypothetical protein BWY40_01261 [bacterium ADurb.Bin270]HQC50875.1 hypothetical protein [bacterium]
MRRGYLKCGAGFVSVEMILAIPFVAALIFGFAMIVSASISGMTDSMRSFYISRGRSMFCEGFCLPRVESKKILPSLQALPPDLSNEILRGGDTPSPYCRSSGGYRLCAL